MLNPHHVKDIVKFCSNKNSYSSNISFCLNKEFSYETLETSFNSPHGDQFKIYTDKVLIAGTQVKYTHNKIELFLSSPQRSSAQAELNKIHDGFKNAFISSAMESGFATRQIELNGRQSFGAVRNNDGSAWTEKLSSVTAATKDFVDIFSEVFDNGGTKYILKYDSDTHLIGIIQLEDEKATEIIDTNNPSQVNHDGSVSWVSMVAVGNLSNLGETITSAGHFGNLYQKCRETYTRISDEEFTVEITCW